MKLNCLNYTFQNPALLKQALTHRSAHHLNNERLEFLGDAILSAVIAEALYEIFPDKNEGNLSRLRASLVKEDMLAEIAHNLKLGNLLFLGQGELKTGGFRRPSILADALEAILGAIFLDSDFLTVKNIILSLYHSYLSDPNLPMQLIDAKTQLQELLQAQKSALPEYHLTHTTGEEHDQQFHVTCTLKNKNLQTFGQAETRKKAEQIAAKCMMDKLRYKTST